MKIIPFLLILLFAFAISAKPLGPDVAEYNGEKLKWEEGARSYFVMFKSLLENRDAEGDLPNNPQADHCMDESIGSTYTLDLTHIPQDAYVDRAFLVWTGAVPETALNGTVDNKITLKFSSKEDCHSVSSEIESPAKKLSSANDFSFESYRFPDDPDEAYFTYRVDITWFFHKIHEEARMAGVDGFGLQLLGDYTVSNLACTDDPRYVTKSTMVAGWSIILIYTSVEIRPKKMYIYNGLAGYFHQMSEITVSGFEFPNDPIIRLTLSSFEGDPGRATLVDPDGGSAFPEGIEVQGDMVDWLPLKNVCNPTASIDDGADVLSYVEVFNSVSSQYGLFDANPTCIGGTPSDYDSTMEYGVDMDTFVMDTTKDDDFASHFYRGGNHINMKIGANQDWVLTNFLVASVDTRAANFDIPGEPENFVCGHLGQNQEQWCDGSEEMWFAIKVQNWGDDGTSGVVVFDSIDTDLMEYVPGTTSYAVKFFKVDDKEWQVKAEDWIMVPDNGGFPLETGVRITELPTMRACNEGKGVPIGTTITPEDCPDTALVRFKVRLKDVPKHALVQNIGSITSAGMLNPYKTNTDIALRLVNKNESCQEIIDRTLCGGVYRGDPPCRSDADCPYDDYGIWMECDTESGQCLPYTPDDQYLTTDVAVTVYESNNSPHATNGVIIVPPVVEDLVLGRVTFYSKEFSKYYFLEEFIVGFTIADDSPVSIKNIKLLEDVSMQHPLEDTTRIVGQSIVSEKIATISSYYPTSIDERESHFLIVGDIEHSEESVKKGETYRAYLKDSSAVTLSDNGQPTVKFTDINGDEIEKIEFATFMAEPDDGFIVTTTGRETALCEDWRDGVYSLFPLRVKSKGQENVIKKIRVEISPETPDAKFGEEIAAISIYEDLDGDGSYSGEKKLVEIKEFITQTVDLTIDYKLPADTSAHLIVAVTLKKGDADSEDEMVQLTIPKDGVVLEKSTDIYLLPILSQKWRASDDVDVQPIDHSCECTITTVEKGPKIYAFLLFLMIFPLVGLFVRRKQ